MQHRATRGIALVITLIMLSVTLVMAIAFIAVSQRGKNAASTGTDSTTARLAADAALAAAQAQIMANIFVTNASAYDFKMLVSTNYQNSFGYVPGIQSPTNVNYDYRNDGNPLNAADFNQNVANLYFLPRVPVSIFNRATGSNDFRFYLDLNRNGRFETNGWGPNFTGIAATPFYDTNGIPVSDASVTYNFIPPNIASNFNIGDPEWVGILERPDQPHSADNHFLARYAFLAQPIGNALDLNAIHNQTLNNTLSTSDGFFRNQGVGGWELNLAGFLADLNTNQWGQFVGSGPSAPVGSANYYQYNQPFGSANSGHAFEDARALLKYRYDFNYGNLASASQAMAPIANPLLRTDNIDTYSDGRLQITTTNIDETLAPDQPLTSWVGANNPVSFYALPAELYDRTKTQVGVTAPGFTDRLIDAGISTVLPDSVVRDDVPTYDRYTFYRLLEQLSTDSVVDDKRMNLNYDNLTRAINGVADVNGTASATNLLAWTPLNFFTNAADRMLTFYTSEWLSENTNNFFNYTNTFGASTTSPFGVTHIPVYVNGRFVYTPAVNRLLQLAANLYDATTNDIFPSVFRPLFTRTGTNVFITGYVHVGTVSGTSDFVFSSPTNVESFAQVGGVNIPINIYGVPWIIGAKKGFPNFNRFYSLNNVQVTRKLEVTRTDPGTGPLATNVMYVMSITNHIGWSLWNSYDSNYLGTVDVVVRDNLNMQLSNNVPKTWSSSVTYATPLGYSINNWPGSAWTSSSDVWEAKQPVASSFVYSNWDYAFLPESIYYETIADFRPVVENATWEKGINPVPVLPKFDLRTTNYLQAYLIDRTYGRIVDYVQFAGPASYRQLNEELRDPNYPTPAIKRPMWSTNTPLGVVGMTPNWGIADQIFVSRTHQDVPAPGWKSPPNVPAALKGNPVAEAAFFNNFYVATNVAVVNGIAYPNNSLVQQAPYTPSRLIYEYTMWSANDPLVHYLSSDLQESTGSKYGKNDGETASPMPEPDKVLNALDHIAALAESRYQPWGRNSQLAKQNGQFDNANRFNYAYHDSLVWGSDFWDFPTNKYPSAGWIGRVHRGTPWQTVFLKATNILDYLVSSGTDSAGKPTYYPAGVNTWNLWTGNQNIYDNVHSAPLNDRLLFDLFTAAPNDNAQRGGMSVNQTGIASLSALLSGLVVLTNITDAVIGDYPSALTTPILTNMIISPAGVDTANSAVRQIQSAIIAGRGNTNVFPQAVFQHVGDILRVPALTEQSPFINFGPGGPLNPSPAYHQNDISDELYEWLPQQTMGLLRLGTPRFVVYCYGQTLKPAKNGTVLSPGGFSQLITNYQVVAESALRVVLRVENATGTNGSPRVVIESSRPLAPE